MWEYWLSAVKPFSGKIRNKGKRFSHFSHSSCSLCCTESGFFCRSKYDGIFPQWRLWNTTSRQYCWIAVLIFCSIVVEQYFSSAPNPAEGFLRHNGGLLHFPVRQMPVRGSFCCLRSYGYFTPVGQPYSGVVPYSRTGVHATFGLIHQLVQRSDFTVLIVSANISVLLMAVLSILSFDVDRILSHLWVIIILILAVLLLDSICCSYISVGRRSKSESTWLSSMCLL